MMTYVVKNLWILTLTLRLSIRVHSEPQVPCYFIFGDSLVDNGNNMALPTLAKAMTLPYGIDFPRGPTGRFTNGRTVVDVVSQLLGFEDFIPPHANTRGTDLLKGVNYGSSAAGIMNDIGQEFGLVNGLSRQLDNHLGTILRVVNLFGNHNKAANHLSQCLYSVGMGSNDYLAYMNPQRGSQYTPEQYADTLFRQYSRQLRTLYSYGARKVAIMGVGPVGYSPFAISECSHGSGWSCVERLNNAALLFNGKVKDLVDNLNKNLPGARFTYLDAYHILDGVWRNSSSYGFKVTTTSCCESVRDRSQYACMPLQTPCRNRTRYTFFDAFHPTEALNVIIGRKYYSAESPLEAYPVDIRGLIRL